MGDSTDLMPMSCYLDEDLEALRRDRPMGHLHLAGLDALIDGIRPRLTIIAAAPGAGKTSLLSQILDDAASDGIPTVFFELELSRSTILAKSLARLDGGRLGVNGLGDDALDEAGRAELIATSDDYRRSIAPSIRIVDGPSDLAAIESAVGRLTDMTGRPVVVGIDYLQVIPVPDMGVVDDLLSLRRVAQAIAGMVRRHGCSVFALSSVSRQNYRGATDLNAIGGCSSFEYASDAVAFINVDSSRDEQQRNYERRDRPVKLSLLKNRYGPTGDVRLTFDTTHARFLERTR